MPTPDELADALAWRERYARPSKQQLRTLAREAAKEALLETAEWFKHNSQNRIGVVRILENRAEQIGGGS